MKDVGKLFKEMLSVVSGVANYFGKSNYGTHHLDEEHKKQGVAQGIKSHSETRFSSSYYQVVSVNSCKNAINKCIQSRTLKFDTATTRKLLPYIEDGATHWHFMAKMSGFIHLLAAGANGLLTLEGQNTNCTDIFYVWVCITYQLEQVFTNPSIVVEAYNHRFHQMMMESSHYVFLTGYYLHPLYRHHGGLQITLPTLVEGQKPKLKLTSILEIYKGEQLRLQDSGSEVVPKLIEEFLAYA
ncbi:hypothetical protein BYT27DRAFT_7254735 [Phlegmacium glaucopus]|nr:hypothetical protein BYT27DRAFT_7254735 [Phlegmacium glaucopus]